MGTYRPPACRSDHARLAAGCGSPGSRTPRRCGRPSSSPPTGAGPIGASTPATSSRSDAASSRVPATMTVLALQDLEALALLAGQAGPIAVIDVGLVDPLAQLLGADTQLGGDPRHRAVAPPARRPSRRRAGRLAPGAPLDTRENPMPARTNDEANSSSPPEVGPPVLTHQ
jgi:hypothetical protein